MKEFENKNVVITGASRGIGLGIAKKLASEGANIAVLAKTDTPHPKLPGTIHTAVEEIKNFGVKKVLFGSFDTFKDKKNFFSYRRSLISKEKDYGRCLSVISINGVKNK